MLISPLSPLQRWFLTPPNTLDLIQKPCNGTAINLISRGFSASFVPRIRSSNCWGQPFNLSQFCQASPGVAHLFYQRTLSESRHLPWVPLNKIMIWSTVLRDHSHVLQLNCCALLSLVYLCCTLREAALSTLVSTCLQHQPGSLSPIHQDEYDGSFFFNNPDLFLFSRALMENIMAQVLR